MKIQKNLSLSQRYSVDGSDAAFFSAQIEDNGGFNTNRNIIDQDVYREHRDEINAAYSLFEDEVFKTADKVKQEGGLCS